MEIKTLLERRTREIIDRSHLAEALRSGKKLRVKLGIDPNRRELHLGHAVTLWKLREFQEAGHRAIFIIGDWTAMIGDPSGKDKTRPALSESEIKDNSKHFFEQAYLILDKTKTETHLQSEWFKNFGLREVIKLSSLVTEKQILAHETFRMRIKKDLPFYHHETIYPLLQGYDSVAVRANVELGALEQKFNLLMGRTIQKAYGQEPQDILMVRYLVGLDGKEKMSKSLGNFVALSDSAEEMFGKIMSIPDNLIIHYFELCTKLPQKTIKQYEQEMKAGRNPKETKEILAQEIAKLYHGEKRAAEAKRIFEAKFGKPPHLPPLPRNRGRGMKGEGVIKADFEIKRSPGTYEIIELLVAGKLVSSRSEARRKIREGAVEVDGSKITNEKAVVKISGNSLIRLGRRFLRILLIGRGKEK